MQHNRYCVVLAMNITELAEKVERKMREGWTCAGGCTPKGEYVMQSMTRYEPWFPKDNAGSSQ